MVKRPVSEKPGRFSKRRIPEEADEAKLEEAYRYAADLYRKIHMYPESGNEEYRTAALVEACLSELGLSVSRPLPTSVVAEQPVNLPKKEKDGEVHGCGAVRILLRAELDAIRIQEETGLPHASCREGYMHACGHDVHIAVLLGTARFFAKSKEFIYIPVKYIFQQDEEGSGKGREMVSSGVVRKEDLVFGFHTRPSIPAGTIGIREGLMHGASRMFDLTVIGEKSHGAMPHFGRDALAAACACVLHSYAALSRRVDPAAPTVVSFGTIHGGSQRNVIVDRAELSGIIRGESPEACLEIGEILEKSCRDAASIFGCRSVCRFAEGYPPLQSDREAVRLLREAVGEYNEKIAEKSPKSVVAVQELTGFSLTADDFAYYSEQGKGCYFYLGSGYPDRENSEIHTGTFQVDESCIRTGITVLVSLIRHLSALAKNEQEEERKE